MLSRSLVLMLPALAIGCDVDPALEGAPVFEDTEAYLDREVLVSFSGPSDGVAQQELEARFNLSMLDRNEQIGVARLYIEGDDGSVKRIAQLLEDDYRVEFAEPNYLVRSQGSANDAYLSYQWNVDVIGARDAWDTTTGAGSVVAVLDTGVRDGGPDGIATLLDGYDFYYGDSDPTDNDGHGTFVAGTIAQSTNNSTGVVGISPDAAILPVKVLSDSGYGDINAIANGVVWAADQGADVINMSLGSPYPSTTLQQACDYAYGKDVVLVAATGNEYASSVGYPAGYSSVIAVGASRYDGSRAAYSNYGSGIDLLAPGGDLSRDDNNDGYADGILQETIEGGRWTYTFWEGTSMATPHVAAAAALLKAQGVNDPDEIYDILTATARDVGSSGYDNTTGYGVLDVAAAVAYADGFDPGDGGGATEPGSGDSSGDDSSTDNSADTTGPAISSVSGYTQGSRFTIQWVTDEPADSYLSFEDYGAYGDAALTTSHSITLTGSRGYSSYFNIESTDADGNTSTTSEYYISL
ncbi:MAG: serine protease [Myxococcota bacterium]|jgi:serine protease